MQEGRHLLQELKEREMVATEAGANSNASSRDLIIIYRRKKEKNPLFHLDRNAIQNMDN